MKIIVAILICSVFRLRGARAQNVNSCPICPNGPILFPNLDLAEGFTCSSFDDVLQFALSPFNFVAPFDLTVEECGIIQAEIDLVCCSLPPATLAPSNAPSPAPTPNPTTPSPTNDPTASPTKTPTTSPTPRPTGFPSISPTSTPTESPTERPTGAPTNPQTPSPTANPTVSPTENPTTSPTPRPTGFPSISPTSAPTGNPTERPTGAPTNPQTPSPTANPTGSPTENPTTNPSGAPTGAPTLPATPGPSSTPTVSPTQKPTTDPSAAPTGAPTLPATPGPSSGPSSAPSAGPTPAPTPPPTLPPFPFIFPPPKIAPVFALPNPPETMSMESVVSALAPLAAAMVAVSTDIIGVLEASSDYSTLLAAIDAAALADALALQNGNFTIFAPINDAFPPRALKVLLRPKNVDLLTQVLLYHVVPGTVTSDMIVSGATFTTLAGEDLTATASKQLSLNLAGENIESTIITINESEVVTADQLASNGVVHSINEVLIPSDLLDILQKFF